MLNNQYEGKTCIVEYYQEEKKKNGADDTSDNYPILQSLKIKSE